MVCTFSPGAAEEVQVNASFFFFAAFGFVVGVIFDSFFEWTFHRYFMHRKFGRITFPFRQHALVHHHVFKADETYHVQQAKDKHTVPMAWWGGPALIAATQVPFVPIALLTGNWAFLAGTFLASGFYYGTYEYMHWCMHVPRERKLERAGVFFRLNGHHLLHHRYMSKNFNVVLPLADWCMGTLLKRAPIKFAQARGTGVPDVQPIEGQERSSANRKRRLFQSFGRGSRRADRSSRVSSRR